MSTSIALRVALLGNPNCGKTALFNLLTGSRQKVANFAGVTVERKEGYLRMSRDRARNLRPATGTTCLLHQSSGEHLRNTVLDVRDDRRLRRTPVASEGEG